MMRRAPLVAVVALAGSMPPAALAQQRPTVRLVLLGQALIRHDPRRVLDAPSSSILPMLSAADVVFTNYEGVILSPGCVCAPTRGGNTAALHGAPPVILDYLQSLHINLLSLANNHAWDYGTDAVVVTLDEARARHLHPAGTGRTIAEATAPALLQVHGVTVALLAMATVKISDSAAATATTPGVNLLRLDNTADWDRNIAAIRDARKHADVVIVYHHFQTVGTPIWQHRWAHAAIDAGASLYVAHGDPWLSGVESYHGRPIFYGLGNYIFQTTTEQGHYPPEVWDSVIADMAIGRDTVSDVRMTPIVMGQGTPGPTFLEGRGFPEMASADTARRILERLATMSVIDGTTLGIRDGVGVLAPTARTDP